MAYDAEKYSANTVIGTVGGGDPVLEDEAKAAAAAANVSHFSYVNYDAQMTNYESRSDIETLAHRRAREAGDQFSDTDFTRSDTYDGT
jgi:hypothetical protein